VVLTSKPLYQPVCSRYRETIISKGSSGYLEWCRYRQWCFWGVWGGSLPRAAKVKKAFISCKTAIRFNLGAVPSPRGLLEAEKPKQSSKPPNGIVKHYSTIHRWVFIKFQNVEPPWTIAIETRPSTAPRKTLQRSNALCLECAMFQSRSTAGEDFRDVLMWTGQWTWSQ